jgi:hypothetical protein
LPFLISGSFLKCGETMLGSKLTATPALPKPGFLLNGRLAARDNVRTLTASMLAAGGDPRIWPAPITGRNRYGTKITPAPGEISFASTTANNISEAGFEAALQAFSRLHSSGADYHSSLCQWFEEIRASITSLLGISGAATILTPSGTDAEVLALAIASGLARRPLTNIIIGPEETGSGIPLAGSGRHYSSHTPHGGPVTEGSAIEGLAGNGLDVAFIPIRDAGGLPRDSADVDQDAADAAGRALRADRDVLLHVLDTSKTGLMGITRKAARLILASAPERVLVAVDACQLRCSLAQIKRDLADGFMVLATGSKFAGGPPFCGAVLLPARLAALAAAKARLPAGIGGYSAALDWPVSFRSRFRKILKAPANIGLGLRWTAALEGVTSIAAVSEDLQARIVARFVKEVSDSAQRLDCVRVYANEADGAPNYASIVPLAVLNTNGTFAPATYARHIQRALMEPGAGPVFHVGQPVTLGPRTVLRVAISACDIAAVTARLTTGASLDRAFEPLAADIARLFDKWTSIVRGKMEG